jgi:thiol-disulfide isomerase/thioredoxin
MFCGVAEAQQNTIRFLLPEYAGYDYVFVLERGAKRDTVADGTSDAQGRMTVAIPAEYSNYRGVGKLLFPGDKRVLVNMIVNNERDVSLTTPPKISGLDSLVYSNSPENEAINRYTTGQARLFERYMQANSQKEKQDIEAEYTALNTEIARSPLYAARIMEIIRYLTASGSSFVIIPEKLQEEQKRFIAEQLNINDLYTSGFWTTFFQVWYENNLNSEDSLLVSQSRAMLNRTQDPILNRELTQTLINSFSRYGREDLMPQIIANVNIPLKGQAAPELAVGDSSFFPKRSLILFYETGCGNCHYELEELKKNYSRLTENKIRVISIAADVATDVFEYTAGKLPWMDKYCDFRGFDGLNFINYGIVGTPTYILTDDEGFVRGRYARLNELLNY